MIGLFISMLCILASLSLYKTLIHVAAETKVDTLHDGQLASAMLTAQMEVQSAGYGIDGADADDVYINPTAGQAQFLWRYFDGTNFQCKGLTETALTENEVTYRVLTLQTVVSGCNETAVLSGLTWTDKAILGRWNTGNTLAAYLVDNSTLFNFALTTTTCSPYGSSNGESHMQVTVSAPSSALLNEVANATVNTFNFCLSNIYPPA